MGSLGLAFDKVRIHNPDDLGEEALPESLRK